MNDNFKQKNNWSNIFLISLISVFGGLLGSFVFYYYIQSWEKNFFWLEYLNSGTRIKSNNKETFLNLEFDNKFENSLISIYKKDIGRKDFLGTSLYSENDKIGGGIALSNDGWAVIKIINEENNKNFNWIGIFKNKSLLEVEEKFYDSATNLYFVKFSWQHFITKQLEDFIKIENNNDKFFTLNNKGLLLPVQVIGFNNDSFYQKNGKFLLSSDLLSKRLVISADVKTVDYLGMPIVNQQGNILGIIDDFNNNYYYAVPVKYFSSKIEELFQNKKINRLQLGWEYYNIEDLVLINDQFNQKFGAYLNSIKIKNNLLLEKDIILKIEDQIIGRENDLAEVIQSFPIKQTIKMDVLRGDKNLKLEFSL